MVSQPSETRDTLSQMLSAAGYEICLFGEGEAIAEVIQRFAPGLILLSAQGLNTDGYTLCREFKSNPQIRSIPVIFIADPTQAVDPAQFFAVGGADYLVPPFVMSEVLVRIANPLQIRDLQKRLLEQQSQRLLKIRESRPLLVSLQRQLHQQSKLLKQRNEQLQQEVEERQQAEEALKIEQEKSEQLLLNVLPRAIVDRLKQEQRVLAERFDDVTILFADIVDFTPLSAQLTPLELVKLLNQIFSNFDRLAEQHGLEKIKTIGDAYMVAGGVPISCNDHAEAVMEMAIAMRQEAKQFLRADGRPLQLRIGINTGTVVAGVIGISKFSYDLWGDAVNIASRMESQGLAGKIQVTEATYQRLQDKYQFEKWGTIHVKGKGKMTTYLLVDRKSHE